MTAAGGVQKVLAKLRANIEAGSFYEAHEMFKTVYHRYRSRRQFEDSYKLAEEGAKLQLEKGQLNCGVELALLLIEAYEADSVAPSEASTQRVLSVMAAFPTAGHSEGYEPPVEECSKLAAVAVKWLRRSDGEQFVPSVELRLAQYIQGVLGWQGLGFALVHFAQAGDMGPLAAAVADAASHGLPHEEDLFLARCALQTATVGPPSRAAQQLEAAGRLLQAYEAATGRALPDTPLMHFVKLYLEALQRRSGQLSQLLLQQYRASLDRDPSLWALVMKARAAHVPAAPAAGMGGLFGDLFRVLAPPPPTPA